MRKLLLAILIVLVVLYLGGIGFVHHLADQSPPLDPAHTALVDAAKRAGAQDLRARRMDDGGLQLDGMLDGHQFALVIPWHWNRQAVLMAHGYSTPGTPIAISVNPLANDPMGSLKMPYSEGFAVGQSAFDKSGLDVKGGTENTYRLAQFVDKLGATRVYLIGVSMGGNIVMASIEKHPGTYAGALAACGVVGGWVPQISWMADIRATYNYFTRGTPYALPGTQDITRSALSTLSSGLFRPYEPLTLVMQIHRIADPVLKLFADARTHPSGRAARILDNIVAVSHTEKDPAAIILPVGTLALGQDDINATLGGSIFDNTATVYASPYLSAAENAALNHGIQRVRADPAAVLRANEWYQPTGHFSAKLVSLYNTIDPLVPSNINEPDLLHLVEQAGNSANLVQYPVSPLVAKDPLFRDQPGLHHCGFTGQQVTTAWDALHRWVETGVKPQP